MVDPINVPLFESKAALAIWEYAPVQPVQPESSNPLTTTQSEEPPIPFNCVQPPVNPGFCFDFDSLLASLENPNLSFFAPETTSSSQLSTFDPTIDPAVFGLPGGSLNTPMPSSFSMPTTDPLDEFMAMCGFSGISPDTTASNFASGAPFNDELPSLLPPPPESPPDLVAPPSLSVEHPSEPVQRSRRIRQEVDEANIIHSTRTWAPTTRKRIADEEVSDRPQKKGKSKQATQG
ncbi:hypothetical protein B0H10DRAFT_2193539 [Mycena sp. CBHHK59/15]|nr:hypothetical protein B0H10DRAFT_2193539 [Mycena sp. CBHHK59/15]